MLKTGARRRRVAALNRLGDRRVAQSRRHQVARICAAICSSCGRFCASRALNKAGLAEGEAGYYKLGFQYDATAFGLSRERFLEAVRAEGVALDKGFNALHVGRSPDRFRPAGPLLEAERAHAGTVVLHHPILLGTEADVEEVARAVEKVWAFREELNA